MNREEKRKDEGKKREGKWHARLTDDLIFKAVYGREDEECKAALIALLNLLLDRKEDPIKSIVYKNPFCIGEHDSLKNPVLDIKVETGEGELLDTEIQVGHLSVYINRSVYYQAELSTEGLEKGLRYDKMKKAVTISIVNGVLFPESGKALQVFRYREAEEGHALTGISELRYLELGKLRPGDKPVSEMTPLERFGVFMRYATDPEHRELIEEIISYGEDVIRMSENLLRKATRDEILLEQQRSREKWERDWATMEAITWERGLERGKAEGLEKGLKEGRKQGIEQGMERGQRIKQEQIATRMKQKGMKEEEIAELTGLKLETIKAL